MKDQFVTVVTDEVYLSKSCHPLTNKVLGPKHLDMVNRRFADGAQVYRRADLCGPQLETRSYIRISPIIVI